MSFDVIWSIVSLILSPFYFTVNVVDLFTGLYSAEYLYGEGKELIDRHTMSTLCMFRVVNIEDINIKYCRELGNKVITKVAQYIKENISKEYIFVRYMGPKFVIVFSGVEEGSVEEFLRTLKDEIETIEIVEETEAVEKTRIINGKEERYVEEAQSVSASPLINIVVSTYYKGTGLEQLTKRLEEYLDTADKTENQINYI